MQVVWNSSGGQSGGGNLLVRRMWEQDRLYHQDNPLRNEVVDAGTGGDAHYAEAYPGIVQARSTS